MNTYTVTLYPEGQPSPPPLTITAKKFVVEGDGIIFFIDDTGQAAAAVPLDLSPVIQRTAP